MSYEPKDLSGALFKNDKEGNDKRPDYRGDCFINGVEYQIGAWLKTSNSGTKFMSLKFEEKKRKDVSSNVPAQGYSRSPAPAQHRAAQQPVDDLGPIPF